MAPLRHELLLAPSVLSGLRALLPFLLTPSSSLCIILCLLTRLFIDMYFACLKVCRPHVCSACEVQKRASDHLGLSYRWL